MSIRNLSTVFLLAGTVCFAVGAVEKGILFTPDIVKNAQNDGGKIIQTDSGEAQVISGGKNLILNMGVSYEITPLGFVSVSMDASGKGRCGFYMAAYDKEGRKIGEDTGLQTVSGKPVSEEYTFRVRKIYGAKIPCKVSMSIFVEKNSDVSVSNLKMQINNNPGNPTLTAKTRTDWAAGTYAMLTKRAQTEKNIPVMFLGDSITMLWEFPRDHKYPGGLDSWNKHFKPMGASNYGISGDTVENVLWRVTEGKQLECNPSLIVLMIGTNNLHQRPFSTPEEIVAGIDNLIQTIQTKLPKTKILLLGIFPRRGSYPISEINAKLADFAKARKIDYMDLTAAFLQGKKEVTTEIFRDGLHLSPAGYEIWAQAILPEIIRMTKK